MSIFEKIYAASPSGDQLINDFQLSDPGASTDVSTLIARIINWILYIIAVTAFIYLLIAGITYITAGGNAEQAKKGQQGIINAVIGIAIAVLSLVILKATGNLARRTL